MSWWLLLYVWCMGHHESPGLMGKSSVGVWTSRACGLSQAQPSYAQPKFGLLPVKVFISTVLVSFDLC